MSRQPMDLTNQRFGRLVALSMGVATKQGRMWHCRCDCGQEVAKLASALRGGIVRSCGCLALEARRSNIVAGREKAHANARARWALYQDGVLQERPPQPWWNNGKRRKAPGPDGKLCSTHVHGVAPGMPPFFNPGCPKCEEKKAAGKVRGDEGPSPDGGELRRMTSRWVDHEKLRAAKRKAVVLPYAERGE
jgi:hypothetical protein